MSETGLFVGQRQLLHSERERARAEAWPVTDRRVYPMPFAGTVRHPYTSSFTPTKHPEMTSTEKLAKAASDRLKRCDEMQSMIDKMQTEIADLTRYKNYIAEIRTQQLDEKLYSNCLLPAYPSKEEREERTPKRRTRSAHGGQRRRKTKRIKRPN